MPNVLLHTLLAQRTLEEWGRRRHSPFDTTSAPCRAAFIHGAFGPDTGYFPGNDALLAELAHRLRTGSLTRQIIHEARTPVESAFAWGWVTHCLADVWMHPAIEAAAAAAVAADSAQASGKAELGARLSSRARLDIAHVRIELGLDAVVLARYPAAGRERAEVVFQPEGLTFLARAYETTFGPVTTPAELYLAHLSVARWHRHLIRLNRLTTSDWDSSVATPARLVAPLLRAGEGRWIQWMGGSPMASAFMSPLPPPQRLLDHVEGAIEAFAAEMNYILDAGPEAVPDRDLEDGGPLSESGPRPGTARTMRHLLERVLGLEETYQEPRAGAKASLVA